MHLLEMKYYSLKMLTDRGNIVKVKDGKKIMKLAKHKDKIKGFLYIHEYN